MIEDPDDYNTEPFPAGAEYEIRIKGRLSQPTLDWFEDMVVTVDTSKSPSQTIIQGAIRDQAALYGLISRIRDLGLVLLSVKHIQRKED